MSDFYTHSRLFFFKNFIEHITTPQVERCDWNAGGNYIPSANDRVQVEGHFVTDGVCVAVTTLAQSSSLLVFLCWRHSFPPLMIRQSRSAVKQDLCRHLYLYTTVSACIHRHMVGTRASAAYNFRCRCQHNCCPCTVSVHTLSFLAIFYKHHL